MQYTLPFAEVAAIPIIRDRLRALHGAIDDRLRHTPEDQLFKAIISGQTLDATSERAFRLLAVRFPGWTGLADATLDEVMQCISEVTHARDKAGYVIECARELLMARGAIDLRFLAGRPARDAFAWLRRLRGVGPKSASSVLNFSDLRMRDFTVDTHVRRLAARLGLIPAKADFDRAHRLLLNMMPDRWERDELYELHWLMKAQGQRVCTFHRPRCADCVLRDLCPAHGERKVNEFIRF